MEAVDGGFGFAKEYPHKIMFESVYCPARERRLINESINFMENLDIKLDGNNYFVGKLAMLEGGLGSYDSGFDRHKIIITTAVALARENYEGKLVTGLPISDLHLREKMKQLLVGEHKIHLNHENYTVNFTQVDVYPQCGVSFFDRFIDDSGSINEALGNKKVGIVDIGEKTTDFCWMNGIQYVDDRSGSLDSGMFQAYKRLLPKLWKIGIKCKIHEVKNFLDKIDCSPEYDALAKEIMSAISGWWNTSELDEIFIVGGGGIPLQPYLWKQADLLPDPQWANVRGMYKCGMIDD